MKVTLESTTKIVTLVIDGKEVPARIWEGETSAGIKCHAFHHQDCRQEQG